eukprot:15052642-Alexandrium_andersonii.AAC.1
MSCSWCAPKYIGQAGVQPATETAIGPACVMHSGGALSKHFKRSLVWVMSDQRAPAQVARCWHNREE